MPELDQSINQNIAIIVDYYYFAVVYVKHYQTEKVKLTKLKLLTPDWLKDLNYFTFFSFCQNVRFYFKLIFLSIIDISSY